MGVSVDELSNTNRQLTNLRMALVLGNICHDTSNVHHKNTEENEAYNSYEESYREEFIEDTDVDELGNNHHLHEYLPDEGYNPESMEEDGYYPEKLTWSYEDLPTEGLHEDLNKYKGPGPCLRPYVLTKFWTVLEARGVARRI